MCREDAGLALWHFGAATLLLRSAPIQSWED
jgi:hypothetical protein